MLDRDLLNKIRRNEKVNSVELKGPIAPKEITKIIDALSYNTYLKAISIYGQVEETALLKLANIHHSITLVFSYTPLSIAVLKALADNSFIKQLEIAYSSLGPQGAKILATSKTLKTLCLSHCNIGTEGLKEIANSPHTQLQALHINSKPHVNCGHFDPYSKKLLTSQESLAIKEVIQLLGKNLKLIELSLCHHQLTTEETLPFSNLTLFSYLKLLNLSYNYIDSTKYLAKMPIRSLNVSYNTITTIEGIIHSKEGANYNLLKNRYLKELYLEGNSRLFNSPSQLNVISANKTLRFFDRMSSSDYSVQCAIALNKQYEIQRKNDFVRAFCMFAKEKYHWEKKIPQKMSSIGALPEDVWFIILSFINFAKMDKDHRAGQACCKFIFTHISLLIEQSHQYKLAVIEKISKDFTPYEYHYQFKPQKGNAVQLK